MKCTIWVHEDKNIKQISHYAQEKGRSMVEMLGVLAIIGVLSVGGIAGYSKAMEKYKLNKYISDVNTLLINYMTLHTNQQTKDSIKAQYYAPESLFNDFNSEKGYLSFYDIFNNRWGTNTSGLYLYINDTSISCPVIIKTAIDMNISKLSLFHRTADIYICNEKNCRYKFNQMNMEKTREICDIIANAKGTAILYFEF